MNGQRKRILMAGVLGVAVLLPWTGVAAQVQLSDGIAPAGEPTAELRRPPRVEPTDGYSGLVMTLIVVVCVAAVAGAVLIPGQRTHQD